MESIVARTRDGDEGYETDVPYATISFADDCITAALRAARGS